MPHKAKWLAQGFLKIIIRKKRRLAASTRSAGRAQGEPLRHHAGTVTRLPPAPSSQSRPHRKRP